MHHTRLRTRSVTVEARPHMVPYHRGCTLNFSYLDGQSVSHASRFRNLLEQEPSASSA